MNQSYAEIFRAHFRPLEPLPTGEQPVLRRLAGLRAVLFDLYGTLFISGSGEVGTVAAPADMALSEALAAVGLRLLGPPAEAAGIWFEAVRQAHARARAAGIDYPEVQVVELWGELLGQLRQRGWLDGRLSGQGELARLAVEYEARANPCWPMPGLAECLAGLRAKGKLLGIISNAQFYTPALFPALLGVEAEQLGFARELVFYSYQHGRAKPGTWLHQQAARRLAGQGIAPAEVLYVGNDMLNDIWPAAQVGFATGLFAGDGRSLRWRQGEPEMAALRPDIVLTCLADLDRCVIS